MKSGKQYALFAIILMLGSVCGQAQITVAGYTNYTMHGFHVLVEDNAVVQSNTMTTAAVNLLDAKLLEISQMCLAPVILDSLRAVTIFVDWNTTTGAAQYHPSKDWLIANGYLPEKARCVEISNVTNFVNWTNQNQPYMVLHEMAHAYHHRVFEYNHPAITQAYNEAVSLGLYTNISYYSGNGVYFNQPSAYGLNNEFEFFAELTEAFLGYNDYFPFDRADLKAYHPLGYDMVKSIWLTGIDLGVDLQPFTLTSQAIGASYQWLTCGTYQPISGAVSQSFSPTVAGAYAVEITQNGCVDTSACAEISVVNALANDFGSGFRVFPNPLNELLNIDLGRSYAGGSVTIFDMQGRALLQAKHSQGQLWKMRTELPSGFYMARIEAEGKVAVVKILKE
ncbi:MAG: T9SS type A sorting domain-containing protein [Bacteroidia bacterium]|nr:T9SS type A sorting domain-containing protein [Bacteroidia bacterium]